MSGIVNTFESLVGKGLNLLGGGGEVKSPDLPDYEAERKKAEEEAQKKRNQLAALGMSGTILGGATGDDTKLAKKKLLGE